MTKLLALLNKKRPHFYNRLKQRNGKWWIIKFLFAVKLEDKTFKAHFNRRENLKAYRFKDYVFLVENNKLQTFINKEISKQEEKLQRKLNNIKYS